MPRLTPDDHAIVVSETNHEHGKSPVDACTFSFARASGAQEVYDDGVLPRPTRRALAEWDKFRKIAGANPGDTDYFDPLGPDEWLRGINIAAKSARPSTIFYFAKPGTAVQLASKWKTALPKNATCITRGALATAADAAIVRDEALRCKRRVRFFGDLDPQDLAIYLSLAFGSHTMRPQPATAVPILHTGINDAWLDAAEAAWPRRGEWSSRSFLDCAAIAMEDEQRRYLEVVEQLGPPLETWVGPRCAALLRQGTKIEVEAFLNLPVRSVPYARSLRRLLQLSTDGFRSAELKAQRRNPKPRGRAGRARTA
jgi:hypothetical protein